MLLPRSPMLQPTAYSNYQLSADPWSSQAVPIMLVPLSSYEQLIRQHHRPSNSRRSLLVRDGGVFSCLVDFLQHTMTNKLGRMYTCKCRMLSRCVACFVSRTAHWADQFMQASIQLWSENSTDLKIHVYCILQQHGWSRQVSNLSLLKVER